MTGAFRFLRRRGTSVFNRTIYYYYQKKELKRYLLGNWAEIKIFHEIMCCFRIGNS